MGGGGRKDRKPTNINTAFETKLWLEATKQRPEQKSKQQPTTIGFSNTTHKRLPQ